MQRSDLPQPPADDAGEMIEITDRDGTSTGRTATRETVHQDGLWHRTFHLWVLNGEGAAIMQRRSKVKQIEPGRLDLSVGGHYRAGEELTDVLREADEEIGLRLRPGDITHLLTRSNERFYDHATDREVQEVYVVRSSLQLHEYRMNCREVSVLYEVPLAGLLELYRNLTPLAVAGHDCQGRENNALLHEADLIMRARDEMVDITTRLLEWHAANP